MSDTLIIQSHRSPLPFNWIQSCLDSVKSWSKSNGYDYRFINDDLFNSVPLHLIEKTKHQRVIATDLARLMVLQQMLKEGYNTVIWMDADFYIFDSPGFKLPETPYAVGREVWIQPDQNGRLKTWKKVHNAFLMFRQNNCLLDFYIDTASQLLEKNAGVMPPQFIGPKLLTALHNICQFPVMETAGMLSPAVINDLIKGNGKALKLFNQHSDEPISAANLCSSSVENNEVSNQDIIKAIGLLKINGTELFTLTH